MPDIYRPDVKVGSCITLEEMSLKLGGSPRLLLRHRSRGTDGFPKQVARFGNAHLYVEKELDAFYTSVQWRQANRSVKELTGDMT
ncbi:MAG: hypothetical protein BWY85_02302 [Firmicutes bacterium ADurb.Bin506]|nr:MAG: hypothetical protein BWY85_02302 [Firmicutes bacterium ADurb.Bin506]